MSIRWMEIARAAMLLLAVGVCRPAAAEPFDAVVAQPTEARSGPGMRYYAVSSLAVGDRLEAYAERDGFVAVRPPRGSQSLIGTDDVREIASGEGEVLRDDTPVRLSGVGGECNAVQVRLDRGDRVRLVARDTTPDGNQWWSIEPPAGEFRWVPREAVERTTVAVRPQGVTPLGSLDSAGPSTQTVPAAAPLAAFPTTKPFEPFAPYADTGASQPVTSPRALPPVTPIGGDFSQRLTALELALATIVVERPSVWRFEPLEAEAASLLVAAPSEADRQAVRDIADRIDRFATIGDRYRAGRGSTDAVAQSGWRQSGPRPGANGLAIAEPNGGFDGAANLAPDVRRTKATTPNGSAEGVLRPVVSARPGAPTFALVDDRGRVTTLVTPSPGVDLTALVGKRLSIDGAPGFVPEYNRPHMTAERVTPLETFRR
jgi:hypothetical protein